MSLSISSRQSNRLLILGALALSSAVSASAGTLVCESFVKTGPSHGNPQSQTYRATYEFVSFYDVRATWIVNEGTPAARTTTAKLVQAGSPKIEGGRFFTAVGQNSEKQQISINLFVVRAADGLHGYQVTDLNEWFGDQLSSFTCKESD